MLVQMPQAHPSDYAAVMPLDAGNPAGPPDAGNAAYAAYREGWRSRDALERERTEQAWRIIRKLRRRNATAREALRQSRARIARLQRLQDKAHAVTTMMLAVAIVAAMIGWAAWWTARPVMQERLTPASGLRMAAEIPTGAAR